MLQKMGEPAMKSITIGMDLGDKKHQLYVMDSQGSAIEKRSIENTCKALDALSMQYPESTVVLEAGTHSPWISRRLKEHGHKVLVGNPRKLRMIWESDAKSDMRDAEMLARIARFDSHLLYPIEHRNEQAQADLSMIKARDALVKSRSSLINFIRSSVKSMGYRIRTCSSECFHKTAEEQLPEALREGLLPVVKMIASLTARIREYDKLVRQTSEERYPETECLQQIGGVGPLTALAYILTLEQTDRFRTNRQVGSYVGLTPRRDQSGEVDKQLRITKAGNGYLRRLLVGSAQYILGPFGPDCNLRRFGLRLVERGGKYAKKRAVVALARKLAILLHRLWRTGEVYDPFYKPGAVRMQLVA